MIILNFLVYWLIFYFPLKLFVLFLVKHYDGFIARFWGADFYSFSIDERRRKVKRITILIDSVLSLLLCMLSVVLFD